MPPPVPEHPASAAPAPARRPGGPPLSSRGVLLVGGLALLCLAMATALAFEATDDAPPALDAPAPAPFAASAAEVPAESPALLPAVEATPVPDSTLPALERAAAGPLEDELALLLAAVQHGFGVASVEVEPSLRPYVAHAVGRLNVHPGAFSVVVTAPDAALAERRAAALRAAFASAGMPPDRLPITAAAGPPALALTP